MSFFIGYVHLGHTNSKFCFTSTPTHFFAIILLHAHVQEPMPYIFRYIRLQQQLYYCSLQISSMKANILKQSQNQHITWSETDIRTMANCTYLRY